MRFTCSNMTILQKKMKIRYTSAFSPLNIIRSQMFYCIFFFSKKSLAESEQLVRTNMIRY